MPCASPAVRRSRVSRVAERAGTAADALAAAEAELRRGGVAEPRREAARLAEAAWQLEPGGARLAPARVLDDHSVARLEAMALRRAAGEPLAYVTGVIGFRRLTLGIDRRALIPRPETERLVELALERVDTGVAADVGTGSGALALALAEEGRFDRVLGTDLSPEALNLARENGRRTGLTVEWREGALLAPLAGERLDLLVSNPPYLTDAEYAALDPSVRAWEPALALPSGADGLAVTRRLLDEGRAVVRPGGWIALEVDCQRAAEVARLAAAFGWTEPAVHQDLYDRARVVLARRSASS